MAEHDEAHPSLIFTAADGSDVPMYLVSFDKDGACTAPRTRAAVLAAAAGGAFTDVHIYSHGWNNVFDEAVRHYTEFFTGYLKLSSQAGLDPARYKPLLVGVIWPSTALLAPGEETPALASLAAGATVPDELAEVGAELAPEAARQLTSLVSRPGPLAGEDARALARLLVPLLRAHGGGDDDGVAAAMAADADTLLRNWGTRAAAPGASVGAPGTLGIGGANDSTAPTTAGLLAFLNPREILRKATVYLMKDRAGVVGRNGVAELLRDAVAQGRPVHLTGHSYGAKVMLSALARLPAGNKVASVLLLQPAVSAWCFAERIAEHGGAPGGYRQVLDKTAVPLATTFSPHDRALTSFYPLALRRGTDEGEIEAGAPTSRFAALGGAGPQGLAAGEVEHLAIRDQGHPYATPGGGVRLRALDGTTGIGGHGDVRNRYTEWALASLVRMGSAP